MFQLVKSWKLYWFACFSWWSAGSGTGLHVSAGEALEAVLVCVFQPVKRWKLYWFTCFSW